MIELLQRKRSLSLTLYFLAFALFFPACSSTVGYREKSKLSPKAKNIIFMVPDGMGLSNVTAARVFKDGHNGDPLYLETLTSIGYQQTHSANSTITDSAAAASAWASGEKFRNGEISCHDEDQDGKCEPAPVPTILELAKEKGKATGLVATSTITHATPAPFAAHVHTRRCENEIARQYIQVTEVEVILGGGETRFTSTEGEADVCGTFGNFIADAIEKGYEVVYTKNTMTNAVSKGAERILGLFSPAGKTPEFFRVDPEQVYPADEPTLSEMTAAALEILEKDVDGFFLVVEGSQIDWANHHHNFFHQICETLAFDEAVKVVLDWINQEPTRKLSTLVIIAPDHETGGFSISGPKGELAQPGDFVEEAWISGKHTGNDVLIWSEGPGSHRLARPLDNTDIFSIMKDVLR